MEQSFSKKLILRRLCQSDEKSFLEGLKDWEGEDLTWYTFDWHQGMDFSQLLERLDKNQRGEDIPKNFVPSTMLYAFIGEQIVGRVSIRHELNEALKKRGGHIGYAVAPRFRKQGYAKEMLTQALSFCNSRGLSEVIITCSKDNIVSVKLIEGVNSQYIESFFDEESGEVTNRYIVSLTIDEH